MQLSTSDQIQGKRQNSWTRVILLNLLIARIVFVVLKRLKAQPYDQRAINKRYINPIMMQLVGRRKGNLAKLHHIGRKSGHSYTTPVAVMPIAHGFVIPLTYGADVDWCRNILANGGCTLQWHGATYQLVKPEVVTTSSVISEVSRFQQVIFRTLKFSYVLKLELSTSVESFLPTLSK